MTIPKPLILSPQLNRFRSQIQAKIAQIDARSQPPALLVDKFKRKHDYLRISLTERCNLRCFYCMPEDGIDLTPSPKLLTADEVVRLARIFVRSGVTKIRLTGGEPSVRRDLVDIVARIASERQSGLKTIAMTSNGIALERKLPDLVRAGLTHLNLSLDTLDPFKFEFMTRRRGHSSVLKCLEAALSSNLRSVKLNVVVIRGLNDSEVPDFVAMTKDNKIAIRFIEYMPFQGNGWDRSKLVPSDELLRSLRTQHPIISPLPMESDGTAKMYRVPGYRGSLGFISSMSNEFCGTCNRLRITADGQIKVCLFDPHEISLRDYMRASADDNLLLEVVQRALGEKKEKHAGMEDIDVVNNRPMIRIATRPHPNGWPTSVMPLARRAGGPSIRRSARLLSMAPDKVALTHLDDRTGLPKMVDVTAKGKTYRRAMACGRIYLTREAYELLDSSSDGSHFTEAQRKSKKKGNLLITAQLAGIMGAKRTADLIPLCHPLPLGSVSVDFTPEPETFSVLCIGTVSCVANTGVEMEALTAVSTALLTMWDMLKAVAGENMTIGDIKVLSKSGGKYDFARM